MSICSPEPDRIRAGTTVQWSRTASDYAAGWTGSYKLNRAGATEISISATNTNGVYAVDVKPATTSGWAAGVYNWVFLVTDGTDTYAAASGSMEIVALNATGNALTDAKAYLAAAEAELAERTSGKASSYSIKDRSLTRMSASELVSAITYWRGRVSTLQAQADVSKCGRSERRITYARFR